MTQNYINGFRDTAERHGIDADLLTKVAFGQPSAEHRKAVESYMSSNGLKSIDYRGASGKQHLLGIIQAARRQGNGAAVKKELERFGYKF